MYLFLFEYPYLVAGYGQESKLALQVKSEHHFRAYMNWPLYRFTQDNTMLPPFFQDLQGMCISTDCKNRFNSLPPMLLIEWNSLHCFDMQTCHKCNLAVITRTVDSGTPIFYLDDLVFQRLEDSRTHPHTILTRYFQPSHLPFLRDFAILSRLEDLSWYREGKKNHSVYAVSLQDILEYGYSTFPEIPPILPCCKGCGCSSQDYFTPPRRQYFYRKSPKYLCFHRNIRNPDYFYGTQTDPMSTQNAQNECINQMPVILIQESVKFTQWPNDTYILKVVVAASHMKDEAGRMEDDKLFCVTKCDYTSSWYSHGELSSQIVDFTDILFLRRVKSLYYERQVRPASL
jgi:hypothetical protein